MSGWIFSAGFDQINGPDPVLRRPSAGRTGQPANPVFVKNFKEGGTAMIKVKTFASPLKIFQAKKEIEESGATIGLIRVLAYE